MPCAWPAAHVRRKLGMYRIIVSRIHGTCAMATREQLQSLARLRLREAEVLFEAGFFDGCAYLCGYVVELALKATICATLDVSEYPSEVKAPLRMAFRTHDFDDLKLLAGIERDLSASNPVLLTNWSVANRWRPEWRYEPAGTYNRTAAQEILNAIRVEPNGVLSWLSLHW
jgi:HEPN domain-containing protein